MSSISVAPLPFCRGLAALERRPPLDARRGDGQRHDDRREQLQALHRHDLRVEYDRVDEAVDQRADERGEHATRHAAAAEHRFTDDEAGKADDDDAGAGVDVHGLLILAHHRAGKAGHGIGKAEADGDGERRIQRRRAHHVGIIARRAE